MIRPIGAALGLLAFSFGCAGESEVPETVAPSPVTELPQLRGPVLTPKRPGLEGDGSPWTWVALDDGWNAAHGTSTEGVATALAWLEHWFELPPEFGLMAGRVDLDDAGQVACLVARQTWRDLPVPGASVFWFGDGRLSSVRVDARAYCPVPETLDRLLDRSEALAAWERWLNDATLSAEARRGWLGLGTPLEPRLEFMRPRSGPSELRPAWALWPEMWGNKFSIFVDAHTGEIRVGEP